MDPTQTLQYILDHFVSMQTETDADEMQEHREVAVMYLEELTAWLQRDGFAPKVSYVESGDDLQFASQIYAVAAS